MKAKIIKFTQMVESCLNKIGKVCPISNSNLPAWVKIWIRHRRKAH